MNGVGAPSPYGQPASAWQEHHTPDGRAYYYNPATKATQWTKPEDMMSSAEVGFTVLHVGASSSGRLLLTHIIARPRQPTLEGVYC